jgi:type II secretory pathway pseudopilin PulG
VILPRPLARFSHRAATAFTIIETMLAATVMVMGIATALTALQYGLRATDTARNMTLAGQIMQSEIEILRLQNWSQIVGLQNAQETATTPLRIDPATTISSGSGTALDATLTAIANRFTCTRLVADVTGRADIKTITLNVTWTGVDGRTHTLVFQTRYAKDGLSDYFYVAH